MASQKPTVIGFGRGVSNIKSTLLRPALTSHYLCEFQPPITAFITSRIDSNSPTKRNDKLSLACSEASLPGSSLATIDIDNDFHGVSEKHAYRRLYDDRADFTFYVDAEEYYVISFFEAWIGHTVNEQYGANGTEIQKSNYTYRARYPEQYYSKALSITKFERDYNAEKIKTKSTKTLKYNFVNAYPISISSMPLSYDTSGLLKCTVSFFYSRYWIENLGLSSVSNPNTNSPGNPELNVSAATGRALNQSSVGGGFSDSDFDRRVVDALGL
jgi:hypothetical protein